MKNITNWLYSSWTEALGWTLLHSLWQSLAIMIVVITMFRFVSKRAANTRYIIATFGLFTMFIASLGTFFFLWLRSNTTSSTQQVYIDITRRFTSPEIFSQSYFDQLNVLIESNIHWLAISWLVGLFIFTLRLGGSWWYVSSLRTHATPLNNDWQNRLEALALQLNITFNPILAESSRITAPVVIGYLKPMVLLPVGMISGLRTAQIEAILLHELSHIRRHDYLVNVMQSLIETLLFFNPFVWITSSIVRREREHCCDDAVLRYSKPRTYATALAQLEEMRLNRAAFALSLAENKNQLLNRIKRIMEKSVKNYSSREKLIPVLLLITGLVCASWVTLHSQEPNRQETKVVPADTTKKKSATRTFHYKSVTTPGEDGKPKEEIVQYYDSDSDKQHTFIMPPVPPADFVPPVFDFAPMAPMGDFNFAMPPVPAMEWNAEEWDTFGKEFETTFKEHFGKFYEEHQEEFEKMMADMQENFEEKFHAQWNEQLAEVMEHQEDAMEQQAIAMEKRAEVMAHHHEAMAEMQHHMDAWHKEHGEQMKKLEAEMKKIEENMKQFEKALREQLIKDGYLKKDEKISDIHWKQNGDIEINNIEIKQADLPKYRALHDKYFEGHHEMRYVD